MNIIYPAYRNILFLLFFLLPVFSVSSQALLGVGYGTFNIPGANTKLNGTGPTVKFEYIGYNVRTSGFLDISYFAKTQTDTKYSYVYTQLGIKQLLGGDADQKKVLPFLGVGSSWYSPTAQPAVQAIPGPSSDWIFTVDCNIISSR